MKLSPRTKAVIVTHPFGNVANINELQDLHVIEDCTNAFGAEYSNRNKVGNSPNLCVFSFQTVRFASCVEGGAITFPDTEKGRELYERIKKLRYFGIKGSIQEDISEAGGKFCMSDLNATIGLCNMQTLDQQLKTCADNVSYYCLLLHNDRIRPLPCLGNCWLFMLRVRERDKFIEHMRDGGVMASPVHRRNDVYSCVEKYKTTLHGLDKFEREYVAIPCGWWLSEEERELILKLMNAF